MAEDVRWLSPTEDRAWRGWLRMAALVRTQIGRDLQADSGLSEPDFVVLVHLSEAPDQLLRMSDLSDGLGWSKSRLSHQVARMEARGLVERRECTTDARASFAALTPAGRAAITAAAPLHVASVRRNLIDLLDPDQIEALAAITDLVNGQLGSQLLPSCSTDGPPSDTEDEGCPGDALPPGPAEMPCPTAQPLGWSAEEAGSRS